MTRQDKQPPEEDLRSLEPQPDKPTRRCNLCQTRLRLTVRNWYPDQRAPDGFRSVCRRCENVKREEARQRHARKATEKMDKGVLAILDKLSGSQKFDLRGVPHLAELTEHIVKAFGGAEMLAHHMAAQYVASPAGGMARNQMLKLIANMVINTTREGRSSESLSQVSTADLMKKLRATQLELISRDDAKKLEARDAKRNGRPTVVVEEPPE